MNSNFNKCIFLFNKQLQDLQNSNKKIIILGACTVGKIIKSTLDNLEITAECFFDNSEYKQNTKFEGLQVYSPKAFKGSANYKIYICALNSFSVKAITEELNALGYTNCEVPWFLLYYYNNKSKISRNLYNQCDYTDIKDFRPVIMDILSVEATEKCTLRCKDCMNLMPYFKAPKNFNKDTLISSIKKLSDAVDIFGCVSIVGGEPMLYPQLFEVFEAMSDIPNILLKSLITNASIKPQKDYLLKLKPYISYIRISDYGPQLSKYRAQWTNILDGIGLPYEVWTEKQLWTELGAPRKNNRTDKENQKIFENCLFTGCHMIINNTYYSCVHAGNIISLGAAPKVKGEYIDLSDANITPEELRTQMNELLSRKKFLSMCDYCNGPCGKKVKPALQATKMPLTD